MTSHVGVPAGGLSMTELRQKLHGHLRSNGALGQLKTQLRTMILTEVMRATPVTEGGSGPVCKRSYTETLADALVAQHLSATGKPFSGSVFASEANLTPSPDDEHELRKILRTTDNDGSVLVAMIRDAKDRTAVAAPSVSFGAQTEDDLHDRTMEQRLGEIDSEFARKQRESTVATRADVELHLSNYRAALEADMRRELEQMTRAFRERELSAMRQQEAAKYSGILKLKQEEFAELERSLQHRVAFERTRMDQLRKDLELRAADMDRRSQEAFSQLDDRDKRISELEGKLRDARCRMQQMRDDVLRYEELAAQRLKDLEMARSREQRRIEDIRQMQIEHNNELRVRSDEVAALMQRFREGAPRVALPQRPDVAIDDRPSRTEPTRGEGISAGAGERVPAASDSRKQPPTDVVPLPNKAVAPPPMQVTPRGGDAVRPTPAENVFVAAEDNTHDTSVPSAHDAERVHHLSQVSTITGHTTATRKAQEDLTHHSESTPSSSSSVSRSDGDSVTETVAQEAANAVAELDADQARGRLSIEVEQDTGFRDVTDGIRVLLVVLRRERAIAPLKDQERVGREVLMTEEDAAFKQVLWSAKRSKDDAVAREDAATAAKYGGGMSSRPAAMAPVFVVSDDEDGSDLLFKKSSDDESF